MKFKAMDRRIVLASQSERRQMLLTEAGFVFETRPYLGEEQSVFKRPHRIVTDLARQKACGVDSNPDEIIIGADTIVVLNGKIFGKPNNRADAFVMLKALQGKRHFVYTGVCVKRGERIEIGYRRTAVEFMPLGDGQINEYIESGEPMDKAGAYGIQGIASHFVKSIYGSYDNVVGLPVDLLLQLLGTLQI